MADFYDPEVLARDWQEAVDAAWPEQRQTRIRQAKREEDRRWAERAKTRKIERQMYVSPSDLEQRLLAGEGLDDLVVKAREGKAPKGRAYVVTEAFLDNTFGRLPKGTLLEVAGTPTDPTSLARVSIHA